MPMKKEQIDLENALAWIPDSKTPNGIAEVPLTDLAVEAFHEQLRISGSGRGCSRTTGVRQAISRV
jgi:integrase